MGIASYTIVKTRNPPQLGGDWTLPEWKEAHTLSVESFHPQSSNHHPQVSCKVLYDDVRLYWSFLVRDRYVLAEKLDYQSQVCEDSCVEFFIHPAGASGYFGFETNCIGTMLLKYIEDPTRTPTGFVKATDVPASAVVGVELWHSISERPYIPENPEPQDWRVDVSVPFDLFGKYSPIFTRSTPGTVWRGNFFKCADKSSHPHWASWSPIGEALNFHVPHYFGELRFG